MGTEEEVVGNRQRHNRHARDPAPGSLEKRIDELEKVKDDNLCMNLCRGVFLWNRNNNKTASMATSEEPAVDIPTRLHEQNYLYDCSVNNKQRDFNKKDSLMPHPSRPACYAVITAVKQM